MAVSPRPGTGPVSDLSGLPITLANVAKRLRLLLTVALTLGLGLTACGGTTATQPTPSHSPTSRPSTPPPTYTPSVERPNMLIIEADDMRWDDLRWMPNVTRLIGQRGQYFANSFAPYPLCCPSRASFLSGKYAHNHHVLSHSNPWGFKSFNDSTTIATVLQGAGYQTALLGKYLNGYGAQPIYGTKKSSVHYVPPGWTNWTAGSDHIWPASSPNKGGTYNYMAMTQNINGRIVPHPGIYSTNLLGKQTRAVLKDFEGNGKPWFVWWTPVAPHFGSPSEPDDPAPIWNSGKKFKFPTPARPDWVKGKFDNVITHSLGVPLFGDPEADMSDKPGYLRNLPPLSTDEKIALTNVSRQRAESMFVLDQEVGRTLRAMKKSGQYDRTIVMFTSDNGYFLGEHRKRSGKILPHEPSLRVPLLVAGPGIKPGIRYDPITTVDLAPTFAAYAGISGGMPATDGVSMVKSFETGDTGWTAPLLTEGHMGGFPDKVDKVGFRTGLNERGIRTARWKYVRYAVGEGELYDLKADPLELQNQWTNPQFAGVKKALSKVWLQFHNCKGAACQAALPKRFQMSAEQVAEMTRAEMKRVRTYYDDQGLMGFQLKRVPQ